uniref:b(0,+)-type amino acid transporter 1-like n=1 Tax=Ciona intestinalis TaxID=7719 RepID=UPI000EF5378D|nr:b(0,+)-type amino acid transporter 1-like [Ciona intestinalis]|eukprot:XP_026692789.1 b(0,+)-type amino acid transporter 1-like [Ciona intestinalis]
MSGNSIGKVEEFRLKRKVGFWSGVAIVTSAMVGSGIFVSPGGVVSAVHGSVGLSMVVWVVCGIVAALSTLCYCELGAALKESGGDFVNFEIAYGKMVSYMYVMTFIFMDVGSGISLQVFAAYFISGFIGAGCKAPDIFIKLVACLLLISLSFLNSRSVRSVVKIEIVFTVGKFLAMCLISIGGIIRLVNGDPVGKENFQNAFASEGMAGITAGDIGIAFYQGMFSYTGWMVLNTIAEEVTDVGRNLPRASLFSLLIVTVMYMIVNIGYFSVLSVEEMMTSPAVAVTFANQVLGPMAWIIPFTVCVSTLGNQNGACLLRGRLPFVAARKGYLPKIFSMIHVKYYTPVPSLILNAFFGIIFILCGDVQFLINGFGFVMWTVYGLSAASVIILRYKKPNITRPYRRNATLS